MLTGTARGERVPDAEGAPAPDVSILSEVEGSAKPSRDSSPRAQLVGEHGAGAWLILRLRSGLFRGLTPARRGAGAPSATQTDLRIQPMPPLGPRLDEGPPHRRRVQARGELELRGLFAASAGLRGAGRLGVRGQVLVPRGGRAALPRRVPV